MKASLSALLLFCFLSGDFIYGQSPSIDKVRFFNDTSMLNATISTNLGKVLRERKTGAQLRATFSTTLPNATFVNDPILLEIRGHMRKDYCYLPPLKIVFKCENSSTLTPLGSLKLVSQCKTTGTYEQYLLKEFLVYKIYNLLTDLSFRVRLLNLNFLDSSGKKKSITDHAFLMEDIKDLAKRNKCNDLKEVKLVSEATDRRQMTIVSIFEYMIGNLDWGVSVNHNTRLIMSKKDSLKRPFVVPYDFDYSGLVNTDYALPPEGFDIQNVTERIYRGAPRTRGEVNEVLDIFKQQKENIYALISNFELLTLKSKKEMMSYLDGFFDQINRPDQVKYIFVQNARTQ